MLVLPAPAKINLALEVLGRRPDGYHELVTVMHTLSLHDLVEVSLPGSPTVQVVEGSAGPASESGNTAARAVAAFAEALGQPVAAAVRLWKRVPWGAGLGGASSDAAAVLRALAVMHGLPPDGPLVMSVAARVGSDVPFFVRGGAALAEGRGEIVTGLEAQSAWVALAMGEGRCATAAVYGRLIPADFSDGQSTAGLADRMRGGPADPHRGGGRPNALARAAREESSELDRLLDTLGDAWSVTGSGSAVFRLAQSEREARELAAAAGVPAGWTAVARLTAPG
ncbi:MAG: 4-(cytidine 5'-diphospho)-2-C-methyl-D-erythritol kinase [Candidatus Dormibacteria bacterium]